MPDTRREVEWTSTGDCFLPGPRGRRATPFGCCPTRGSREAPPCAPRRRSADVSRTGAATLFAGALFLLGVIPSSAEEFCVSTAAELRAAFDAAEANGQDDVVRLVSGNYQGTFGYSCPYPYSETYSIRVEGGYAPGCTEQTADPSLTVLDAGGTGVPLYVSTTGNPLADLAVANLTVTGGTAAGLYAVGGNVDISGCAIVDNHGLDPGVETNAYGGAHIKGTISLRVIDCLVSSNTSYGAAVFSDGSGGGGGIYIPESGPVEIRGCIFTGNRTIENYGGALLVNHGASVLLEGNTFENNLAEYVAGVYLDHCSNITVRNNLFTDNWNQWTGGLEENFSLDGDIVLEGNVFRNNRGNGGGGARVGSPVRGGAVKIRGNTFDGNASENIGGGLVVFGGTGIGGAYSPITVANNVFAGNTAQTGGGLWVNTSVPAFLINNTFVGNTATQRAGGAHMEAGGSTATIDITTIDVWNNLFRLNTAPAAAEVEIDNEVILFEAPVYVPLELSHNEYDPAGLAIIQPGYVPAPTNIGPVDPQFLDAAGGNYRLAAESPCMDQGSLSAPGLPATDADGLPRVSGPGVDLGAYETVVAPETVTAPAAPSGPAAGIWNMPHGYGTADALSSWGDTLEYRFDWGDGSFSDWSSSPTGTHSWIWDGAFTLKAQARCAVHPAVVSDWSGGLAVTMSLSGETIGSPVWSGPAVLCPGQSGSFTASTEGEAGHPLFYEFNFNDPYGLLCLIPEGCWGSATWEHAFAQPGEYLIQVRAGCSLHPEARTPWAGAAPLDVVRVLETLGPPGIPVGGAAQVVGTSGAYTAAAASDSCGHSLQYRFDWGDGSDSAWLDAPSASHAWSAEGSWSVRVQARCAAHPAAVSTPSFPLAVAVTAAETISTPAAPSGSATVAAGSTASFVVGGALSSQGHDLCYRIDWGDGTDTGWFVAQSAGRVFSAAGTVQVRCKARCLTHAGVESEWSPPLTVTVTATAAEALSTPAAPSGPIMVAAGSMAFYVAGGASSSQGHELCYLIDWGDGTDTGWLVAQSAGRVFSAAGTVQVRCKARCLAHAGVESEWSPPLTVTVTATGSEESITPPGVPEGPEKVIQGALVAYRVPAAVSSLGHLLEYEFDWGDGPSGAWSSAIQEHLWSHSGILALRARARCSLHPEIASDWSPPLPVEAALFREDFAEDLASWNPMSGSWRIDTGGHLRSSARKAGTIVAVDGVPPLPASGCLEIDLAFGRRWGVRPNAAIVFARKDAGNYRYVRVYRGSNGWRAILAQVGDPAGDASGSGILARSSLALADPGQFHRLRLELHESGGVTARLDGAIDAFLAAFVSPVGGRIGLRTRRALVRFDNLVLQDGVALP